MKPGIKVDDIPDFKSQLFCIYDSLTENLMFILKVADFVRFLKLILTMIQ